MSIDRGMSREDVEHTYIFIQWDNSAVSGAYIHTYSYSGITQPSAEHTYILIQWDNSAVSGAYIHTHTVG